MRPEESRPACMTCRDRKVLTGGGGWEHCPSCIANGRIQVISEQVAAHRRTDWTYGASKAEIGLDD